MKGELLGSPYLGTEPSSQKEEHRMEPTTYQIFFAFLAGIFADRRKDPLYYFKDLPDHLHTFFSFGYTINCDFTDALTACLARHNEDMED